MSEVLDNCDTLGAGGKKQEAGYYQENGAIINDLDRIVLCLGEGPDIEQVKWLQIGINRTVSHREGFEGQFRTIKTQEECY